MAKFLLEILTPEKLFFSGQADSLTVEAMDGSTEILAGHKPIVIGLKPSMLKIRADNTEQICSNSEGFVSVDKDKVVVVCQTVERPEELCPERVNKAIVDHTNKLKFAKNSTEYLISQRTVERALARLKVIEYNKLSH